MKKHNGMRPQDIVVLLKIISMQNQVWRNIDIANALNLSPSEVSEALNRSKIAKLIDGKKKSVNPNSFKEFLIYGLKYVFPVEPGAIVRGIPTAHSASPISENISQGADIHIDNERPLRNAAYQSRFDTGILLVKFGADIEDAIDYCNEHDHNKTYDGLIKIKKEIKRPKK